MAKKINIADAISIIGENEQVLIASVKDTEEGKAVLALGGFPTSTKFIRVSVRAHVSLVNEEGYASFPNQRWFTKAVIDAVLSLEPDSEVAKAAKVVYEAFSREEE